jgi:hypothetical protein
MTLNANEVAKLRRIIAISEKLIAVSRKPKRGRRASTNGKGTAKSVSKRIRRTGRDLIDFRKALKAELKAGMPVAKIAKKHGISTAYVYQL